MTDTPNLALPLIAAAQAQKHVTHNEALAAIDVLLQCAVRDKDLAVPPAAPPEGVRYIVAAAPSGSWAGQEGNIAAWRDGAWAFYAPKPGFIAFVVDEGLLYFYAASGWMPLTSALGAIQNLSLLGLGTTADAANPLSAKLNKALWAAKSTAEGGTGDLRYTFNKDTAGNVLSLLFQTGWAARAELGLIGHDDLVLRVTPDGASAYAALRANRDLHGRLSLKEAMRKTWAAWMPQPGSAALSVLGLGLVQAGTLAAVAPSANVSFYAQTPRVRLVSAAAAGASAGLNGAGLGWWRGNAADQGGFYLLMRAGFEVFQPGARWFMGLYGSTAAIGNVNPSTLLNLIGIGTDAGETTLRLVTNEGSGNATRIDLGPAFPVGGHELYELILSAEPNAGAVQYRVERLNGGNVATGTLDADLPASTAFLTPHIWANNGTSAGAVELGVVGMYVESAALNGSRGKIG
jgi:hypothetical protein